MSASTWLIIAIVGFSLSGIALVAAVFMFIKTNIPAVIGDLTGKTVAREIKAMRDASAADRDKHRRSGGAGINGEGPSKNGAGEALSGSVIAAAHASKRLDRTGSGHSDHLKKDKTGQTSAPVQRVMTTEALAADITGSLAVESRATDVLSPSMATDVLSPSMATDVLAEEGRTDILSDTPSTEILTESVGTEVLSEVRQTEVLSDHTVNEGWAGTSVLSEGEEPSAGGAAPVAFKITRSVVRVHTDEVI